MKSNVVALYNHTFSCNSSTRNSQVALDFASCVQLLLVQLLYMKVSYPQILFALSNFYLHSTCCHTNNIT